MGHDAAHGDFDPAVFAAALDPVVKLHRERDVECFVVHGIFNAENNCIAKSDFNTKIKKVFFRAFSIDIGSGSGFAGGWVMAPCCHHWHC